MSKILVTGATGLIGTNLVLKLKEQGHEVYEMSRSLNLDLQDVERTQKFFNLVEPEIVYHLAANGAESRGQVSPIDMTQRNIGIFVNMLRAAINVEVKKIIYTSSISVYGHADAPYDEVSSIPDPKDVYGANKLACEHILKIMADTYGFDYTIFRPHNVYGPHQKMDDPYRNVVALFMRRLMEGEPYKIYGDGSARRAFSFVDDVVEVLCEAQNDTYNGLTMNLGSKYPVTIKELSNILQRVTGIKAKVEKVPLSKQSIDNFVARHTRQVRITNYADTPLEEGLKRTWEWLQTQKLPELVKQENEIHV